MRKTTTRLTKTKINGERYYVVTWPKIGKGRERQSFKSKGRGKDDPGKLAAETFYKQKLIEQENSGTAGLSFTESQRSEYREATEALKPYGKCIRDAVIAYLPHLKATNRTCTPSELTKALIAAKKGDGASKRYLSDLQSRLGQFARAFEQRKVAEITAAEIDHWLRTLTDSDTGKLLAPTTRNNFRRVLIVAFNFASVSGYCIGNPAKGASKAREVKMPAAILTVQQASDLLTHSDAEIVAAVALGLFAGLRPEAEGLLLDWSHIDFEDKTINVEPDKTKADSSARYVDMSENLIAWLLPYRKLNGGVFPSLGRYYTQLGAARVAAKIEHWPHDALRHSYGTYHYGTHRNAALTQGQMGHTNAQTFFKHYRKPIKKAVADKYWTLMPSKVAKGKVVQFKKAA